MERRIPIPENAVEVSEEISRREFLKVARHVGAIGTLVGINVYLRTEEGKKLITRIIEGDFGKTSNIEVDEKSKEIVNLFNETIETSTEKLGPMEQEAANELKKRRDIVFAAAEKEWCQLKISLNEEGDGSASTNISHNPISEKASIEISLPNMPSPPAEMVRGFSHELGHAYQYIVVLNEFGFSGEEVDELINNFNTAAEYELDAWIFDNLAAYLYTKTHPSDKNYGMLLGPKELGIDLHGFTGYWLGRKEEFPKKLTSDLEYVWFLERYSALLDVGVDILLGEDQGPPAIPLSVRDSEISQEFIEKARKYIVPCTWSVAIGLDMNPTENNLFILRHFVDTPDN